MAAGLKANKRKGTGDPPPSSKKVKKNEVTDDAEANLHNAAKISLKESINEEAVKAKASRKRAADYLDDEENKKLRELTATTEGKKVAPKKIKKKDIVDASGISEELQEKTKRNRLRAPESTSGDAEKHGQGITKSIRSSTRVADEEVNGADYENELDEDSEDLDDQTAALLRGFESSDEEEVVDDGKAIDVIPPIPDEKKLREKLDKATQESDEPGVVYIGRIPHGFYEHEMRAYFSQFGEVTRLRLSRNRKTGQPRHYAFIEFASAEVAAIVAKAMDKYLLFNHILQVRTVPQEQVHRDLFKGANRRFKPIPRAKIAAGKLRYPKSKEEWEKKTKKEENRRRKKLDELKNIGYEFEAPQLKSAEDLGASQTAIELVTDRQPGLLTERPHDEEQQQLATPPEQKPAIEKRKRSKKGTTTSIGNEIKAHELNSNPGTTETVSKASKGKKPKKPSTVLNLA